MNGDGGDTLAEFAVMACKAEIRVAGVDEDVARRAIDAAVAEVRRIEVKYSRYRVDSVVSRINAAAGSGQAMEVDEETAGLLDFASSLYRQSGGLFDITSGVLRRAWNFRSGRLPEQAQLDALLPLVGWHLVRWGEASATAPQRAVELRRPGMELDFGGFGKEYAADRAAMLLFDAGIRHGLVNLGGDIRIIGPRPGGASWQLGIQHPRQPEGTIAGVALGGGALATSGDYERYMEVDGRRYCHILDPRSGWPVEYWRSVSVAAPLCLAAGALSTIAMLLRTDAADFLRSQKVAFLAVDAAGEVLHQGL
ncbi:FAD:protein FMN transferase [Nevskia soli]|uniref:FAD:protein FMN transferase n=1 Tax=Nevskia soli TaxID=418856 RepID=UPI000A49FAA6|nr:FAD:protein FMN transferase [Nevskia soli]